MLTDPDTERGPPVRTSIRRQPNGRVLRTIKCLRLLERACYSAEDLAGHFRVSKRTIYRDLRLLVEADVPLVRRNGDRRYHVPSHWPQADADAPG